MITFIFCNKNQLINYMNNKNLSHKKYVQLQSQNKITVLKTVLIHNLIGNCINTGMLHI